MKKEFQRIWLWPLMLIGTIIVADQVTKYLILQNLGTVPGTSTPLLGDWLKFTLIHNTGIAFGLFQNNAQFFTVTSILISIGTLYFYRYHLPYQLLLVQVCIGMIVGGAIGNIIDRIQYGYVIDFVHVTWFPGIFNLADSCITVGVLVLAVYLLIVGDGPTAQTAPVDNTSQG
ncbi:MAG: signal peptidase II [Chloroflexota bacterium]